MAAYREKLLSPGATLGREDQARKFRMTTKQITFELMTPQQPGGVAERSRQVR